MPTMTGTTGMVMTFPRMGRTFTHTNTNQHDIAIRITQMNIIATIIERMFGRLKDFHRVATRYDKNTENFLSAYDSQRPSAIAFE